MFEGVDIYRVILLAAVAVILALLIYRTFFTVSASASRKQFILFGCRRAGQPSEHGGDILLLAVIAVGLLAFMGFATNAGKDINLTACLVVLTTIINAIEKRWSSRLMGTLANAPPPAGGQGGNQ